MKSFIIVADSHGNIADLLKLKGIFSESDFVVHLGDYYTDIRKMPLNFGEKLYIVKGNCDGGGEDLVLETEGKKILITHGDRYGVKQSLLKLELYAKQIGADIVLYGHTHISDITEKDGITFINPGTLNRYSKKSYCYMALYNGKITAKIVEID